MERWPAGRKRLERKASERSVDCRRTGEWAIPVAAAAAATAVFDHAQSFRYDRSQSKLELLLIHDESSSASIYAAIVCLQVHTVHFELQ